MLLQARQLHRLAQVSSRTPINVIFCAHIRPVRPPNVILRRNLASAKKATPSAREALAKQSLQRPLLKTEPKQPLTPAAKPFSPAQTPIASTPGGGKVPAGYPASLLIYNAGTGKTVFLSAVRLTGIFIFIFSAFLIAPAYYYSEYEPTWMAAVVVGAGAIPILIMTFTTAPFVTYVHLTLPTWARASYPRLVRYSEQLPSTASIDITTIKWIWPRVTRLQASELYLHQNQVGAMTLRRNVPQAVLNARNWYDWRPLERFYVSGKGGKVAEEGIWGNVVGCLAKGWTKRDLKL